MKNVFTKARKKFNGTIISAQLKASELKDRARNVLANNDGEGYVDSAVKILICVVIGALLLALLVYLFRSFIQPGMETRIEQMFATDTTVGP